MARRGSSLEVFNSDLVENIEELRGEREDVNRRLLRLDEERARLQKEIQLMTSRLSEVNHEMSVLSATRSEYDQTIRETEGAYMKVCLFVACVCNGSPPTIQLTRRFLKAPKRCATWCDASL